MPEPKPLTPGIKRMFQVCLAVGPIIVILTILFMDDLPNYLVGALLGGGAALTAMGFIQLFHRPDRVGPDRSG